jgi:hypothetical protein
MKHRLLLIFLVCILNAGLVSGQKIAFLQNRTPTGFQKHQDELVQELENTGYAVTLVDVATKPINFDFLNTQDLVIISRTVNSSDVIAPATAPQENWAKLTVPYLNMSVWTIRNNRMKLVNSATLGASDDKLDLTTISKAKPVVADPVFLGVTSGDSAFACYKGYYEFLDDVMESNSGKVMAVINDDASKGAGRPIMIRWEAGVETYAGSGISNFAARTYLCIGSDNSPQNPPSNYSNYTPQLKRLFMNEVEYLLSTKQATLNGKRIAFLQNRTPTGFQVHQDGLVTRLKNAGYEVTLVDVAVKPIDFASLNTYDLVVISRTVNSSDVISPATAPVNDWAKLQVPYINLSVWTIRNSRMKLVNSATLGASDNKLDLLTITKIKPAVEDPVFQGVTDKLNPFEFYVGYYEFLDDVMDGNSGKVMAVLNDDASKGAGRPVMIRWEANKETYAGSGVTNLAARTFLCIGSDNSPQNPPSNYSNYTMGGLRLFMNEVRHLISPEKEPLKDNLVINGDIEKGNLDTTWVESNTVGGAVYKAGLNTKEPISGNYDFLVDITTAGTNDGRPFVVFYLKDTVRVGDKCKLTFKTKALSGTPSIKYINYGIGVKNVSLALAGDQEWTYEYTATAKTTAIVFYTNGTNVSSFQIDDVTLVKTVAVSSPVLAKASGALEIRCYPNPFSSSTTIGYSLGRETFVNLAVYDMTGKRVITLVNQKQPAGNKLKTWNGTGENGVPIPSGLYFYRIVAGDETATGKMIMQK